MKQPSEGNFFRMLGTTLLKSPRKTRVPAAVEISRVSGSFGAAGLFAFLRNGRKAEKGCPLPAFFWATTPILIFLCFMGLLSLSAIGQIVNAPNAPVFVEDFEVYNDYTLVKPGTGTQPNANLIPEGTYTLIANPSHSHGSFSSFPGHGGSGKMLVANGKGAICSVWSRKISGLTQGKTYTVRLWAANAYPTSPAQLQFRINTDIPLAPILSLQPGQTGVWEQLQSTFVAPDSEILLTVLDNNAVGNGNDFAIDDISIFDAAATYFFENFEYESAYNFTEPGNSAQYPNGNPV